MVKKIKKQVGGIVPGVGAAGVQRPLGGAGAARPLGLKKGGKIKAKRGGVIKKKKK